MTKHITVQNFAQEVEQSDTPILVDFWATWCGPCQSQGPIIDQMDQEGFHVAKIDVDESPELAERFHVMTIPTLIVFNKGEEVSRAVGLHSQEQLEEMLKNA